MKKSIMLAIVLPVLFLLTGCNKNNTKTNVEFKRTPPPAQAVKIPEGVLNNTSLSDKYSDLLNEKNKIIFVVQTDCSGLNSISKFVFKFELKDNEIEKYYDIKFADKSNDIKCSNGLDKCLEAYLSKNCKYDENELCVINPQTKEILVGSFSKDFFRFLAEHKYW